jgi:hypothetical protein
MYQALLKGALCIVTRVIFREEQSLNNLYVNTLKPAGHPGLRTDTALVFLVQ